MSASVDEMRESPPLSEDEKGEATPEKARRRGKTDSAVREFKCGCGKLYLSYPALYTHIRQKHGSSAPTGTSTPSLEKGRGRGRPRKQESGNQSGNAGQILQSGKSDPLLGFDASENNQHRDELFVRVFRQVNHQEAALTPESPCNDVLAAYLIESARTLSAPAYKCLVRFVQSFRRCLNEKGWSVLADQSADQSEFCSQQSMQKVPEMSNTFVTEFLPHDCPNINLKDGIEMMLHLSAWLYREKFSTLRLARE